MTWLDAVHLIVSSLCIVTAGYLMIAERDGWGWLLLVAFLTCPT